MGMIDNKPKVYIRLLVLTILFILIFLEMYGNLYVVHNQKKAINYAKEHFFEPVINYNKSSQIYGWQISVDSIEKNIFSFPDKPVVITISVESNKTLELPNKYRNIVYSQSIKTDESRIEPYYWHSWKLYLEKQGIIGWKFKKSN